MPWSYYRRNERGRSRPTYLIVPETVYDYKNHRFVDDDRKMTPPAIEPVEEEKPASTPPPEIQTQVVYVETPQNLFTLENAIKLSFLKDLLK